MNKYGLTAAVAAATGISKSDAAGAVDITFDVISDAPRHGDDVRLTGFGTFDAAERVTRRLFDAFHGRASTLPGNSGYAARRSNAR